MTPSPSRTDVVELLEYETSQPLRLGRTSLVALASLPPGRIAVLADTEPGLVRLRSTSWVGSVVLEDVVVRVRPKVADLRNVFVMLGAASSTLELSSLEVGYRRDDDFVDGLAELVLRSIDATTRRGLLCGYHEIEDRVPVLRGRLLVGQLATRPWDRLPAPCRFDEFSADVVENRLLRAAVEQLLRLPRVSPAVRRAALALVNRFDEVGPSADPLHEADQIVFTRVNEHYRRSIRLARLVLEGSAINDQQGTVKASSFLVDMNEAFETWVATEVEERLGALFTVMPQASVALSRRPRVPMRPDLVLSAGDKTVLVADTKYKLTGTGLARNADYYQLLAYATALEIDRGLLIYCQADEAPARELCVHGSGHQLSCWPLSLSGSPTDVEHALDDLCRHMLVLLTG